MSCMERKLSKQDVSDSALPKRSEKRITRPELLNAAGVENLCNAIIIQAANDYKAALKKRSKLDRIEDDERRIKAEIRINQTIDDVTRFFHSEWYATISNVNGPMLLRKIHEMTMKEINEAKEAERRKAETMKEKENETQSNSN